MKKYQTKELIKPSFFQKMFKKTPKENYLIELENLLASNEDNLLNISEEQVNSLKSKYKIDDSNFITQREELYDIYLNECLLDEKLTDDEKKCLTHLKQLLSISDSYASTRMKEETEIIYRRKIQCVISDSKIDETEEQELDAMKENLNIDSSAEEEIRSEELTKKVQPFVDSLVKKRRMSPEDEKHLNQLAEDLNVNLTFTDNGLDKLKLLWQIENGELQGIESDINIQKSETLYYKAPIGWYEERTRTTNVNYGGVSTRIRICKGVYINAGSIAPSRHTEEYLKFIDSGDVYITNKRIIFRGEHGNKTIALNKILSYTPYNNGIQIEKDSGKSPCFKCDDPELMGMYLSRVIDDL